MHVAAAVQALTCTGAASCLECSGGKEYWVQHTYPQAEAQPVQAATGSGKSAERQPAPVRQQPHTCSPPQLAHLQLRHQVDPALHLFKLLQLRGAHAHLRGGRGTQRSSVRQTCGAGVGWRRVPAGAGSCRAVVLEAPGGRSGPVPAPALGLPPWIQLPGAA